MKTFCFLSGSQRNIRMLVLSKCVSGYLGLLIYIYIYLWPLGSATSKVLNTELERSVHLANLAATNQFTIAAGIECNISLTHSCMVASSQ